MARTLYLERPKVKYSHDESRLARFVKFNLTTGVFSIAGNLVLMRLLAGVGNMNYLVANGITIAACSVGNFLVSDGFVFAEARQTSIHVSLALDGPNVFRFLLEGIHMHHPAKDLGHEFSAGGVAIRLGRDGTSQSEFCIRSPNFVPFI